MLHFFGLVTSAETSVVG
jgi:diphthamide biosynthesis protein 7